MPSSRNLTLQAEFNRKQDELVDLLSSNRTEQGDYAVSKDECERREKELDDLGVQLRSLQAMEAMEERHSHEVQERRQLVKGHIHAGGSGVASVSTKSLGEQVGEVLAKQPGSGRKAFTQEFTLDVKSWLEAEYKANFVTTAGWLPEARRTGELVPKIAPPLEILQVFPIRPTDTPQPVYMEETVSTSAAAEIAEAGPYQESALALLPRTVNVRKIGTHLPCSDEVLADTAEASTYIDTTLRRFCRRRLESQILTGDGTAPNLLGILNVVGVQTQALGADDRFMAIHKAMTLVRTVGMANPDYVLMNPTDFEDMKLIKETTGRFIMGEPSAAGPSTLWGLPVVLTTILTAGTALVIDSTYFPIYLRQEVEVQVGYVASQFTSGMQTIRADLRAGFAAQRPEAACKVTGI